MAKFDNFSLKYKSSELVVESIDKNFDEVLMDEENYVIQTKFHLSSDFESDKIDFFL